MLLKRHHNLFIAGLAALALSSTLSAQEEKRVGYSVGGGWTQTVGNTGRHLDTGWNLTGSGGINFNRYLSTNLELGYNHFGINNSTLNRSGFPGGTFGIFSATVDPVVRLNPGHHVEAYVIGGGGYYHVTRQFTQPSIATFANFDPFFGFYNVTVPTTEVLDSYSINKPGVNIGMGFTVGTRWRGKFFAEARYNRIFTGNERHLDYVPVAFGFRW